VGPKRRAFYLVACALRLRSSTKRCDLGHRAPIQKALIRKRGLTPPLIDQFGKWSKTMRKEADKLARLFTFLLLGYLVLTAGEVFAFVFVW
jgi:hypothetical protein